MKLINLNLQSQFKFDFKNFQLKFIHSTFLKSIMRSTSPTKSDYTLSKFPAHRIRNMNKEEYYFQRNIVRDKTIPQNHMNYPDAENSKS